jgi:hypothetical protein
MNLSSPPTDRYHYTIASPPSDPTSLTKSHKSNYTPGLHSPYPPNTTWFSSFTFHVPDGFSNSQKMRAQCQSYHVTTCKWKGAACLHRGHGEDCHCRATCLTRVNHDLWSTNVTQPRVFQHDSRYKQTLARGIGTHFSTRFCLPAAIKKAATPMDLH